ncbi:MAG: Cu-Zn family superoxide dismutase [Roseivirga sp.]|jgi:Cu-Zn family superoxide dismutase
MKTKVKISFFATLNIVAILQLFSISSCSQADKVTEASGVIEPTQGNQVKGTVTFKQTSDGVKIVADLTGLTPGQHGFHIHEFGDCSAPDGSSAGGHFNPENQPHGSLMDVDRHAGDMGNILADASGNAHMEFTDKMITLNGAESIINKGLIVHKNADDLKTQPTGNAGPREGCGTITLTRQN